MDIIQTIEKRKYLATAAQVGELAKAYNRADGERTNTSGTYLRILLASLKHELGVDKKHARLPSSDDQLDMLDTIHKPFYAAIYDAVIGPDLISNVNDADSVQHRKALQRNAKTGFARSSKSALSSYIKAGGDIRKLEVATLAKTALNEVTRSMQSESGEVQAPANAETAIQRLVNRLQAIAESDKAAALKLAEQARLALQQCVNEFSAPTRGKVKQAGQRAPWHGSNGEKQQNVA